MNRRLRYLCSWVVSVLLVSCGNGESAHHHHEEADAHGHEHGSDEIVLHKHEADELGVETMVVELSPFAGSQSVAGRVMASPGSIASVTAKSQGIVTLSSDVMPGMVVSKGTRLATISAASMSGGDINAANQIELDAARREMERLRGLLDDGLTTIQEYNAARAAYEKARNMTGTGGMNVALSPIAGVITSVDVSNGQYVDAGQPIATVATTGTVTFEALVPVRYADLARNSATVNVRGVNGEIVSGVKKSVGTVSADNPGYIPVYFDMPNVAGIVSGAVLEANIIGQTEDMKIALPIKSIVDRMGRNFVYVRVDEDCYERRPVTTGSNDGERVEIVSGLNPGDEVVVSNVTFVRLAESSGVIPEGHTHNH